MGDEIVIPYKTGEDMLSLREDLLQARIRILTKYPNLKQDYANKAVCSKYSKENNLTALIPSDVRYYEHKAKIIDKLPNNPDGYREYVCDVDGNVIATNYMRSDGTRKEVLYIIDFEGYKYFIDNPTDLQDAGVIYRLKFNRNNLISYEYYKSGITQSVYCEYYYDVQNKFYCVTEFMRHDFLDDDTALLDELATHSLTDFISTMDEEKRKYAEKAIEESKQLFTGLIQSMKKEKKEFAENVQLPVTDKHSPVNFNLYELIYDNQKNIVQIDEVNLIKGSKKTVYPKHAKNSKLYKTKQSLKKLEDLLRKAGYDYENKIKFEAFWETFKGFALNDKFDCADDSVLWELGYDSVHIARQFIHEDGDGQYEKMEQLNIDFDVGVDFDLAVGKAMWSGDDLEEYFEEIEQSAAFKSISSEAIIELSMYFDEV